jgi:RHS repeat-associated protein
MRLSHLKTVLATGLLAFSAAAFAGEPKPLQYSVLLPTGQTMHTPDCRKAALEGVFATCPTATMADGYPVESPPQPGGSQGSCTYRVWGATSACGGYGGAYISTMNSWYTCGHYPSLGDNTCSAPQEKKNLGQICEDRETPSAAKALSLPKKHNIQCGNPINSATGNKLETETDYNGDGPFPLRFKRHYNSAADLIVEPIGARWRHSYSQAIQLSADGLTASVTRPHGRVYRFQLVNGAWTSDWDVAETLVRLADGGWRLTTRADATETYDAAGKLTRIANRAGVTQTLSYDAAGHLIQVADAFGRTLTLSYHPDSNRIASMTDPGGGQHLYGYDAIANLTSVAYPDGKTRQYLYETPGFKYALTGIVDENGARYATFGYDALGRANLSEHAGGADRVTIVFDDASQSKRSIVTDAFGVSRTYDYALPGGVYKHQKVSRACSGCATLVESETVYNGDGSIYAVFDANRIFTRISETRAGLLDYHSRETSNGTFLRSAQWHPTFRLPTSVSAGDVRQSFEYDAQGNLTRYAIKALGVPGGYPWERASVYTYNAYGQVLTEDGPRTDVTDKTTYAYDAQGNLTTVTNAVGHVTHLTNYDAHGRVGRIVDPNGLAINLVYDARGRLVSRTVGLETTTYGYDGAGQLLKVTMPSGAFIAYGYDAAHRLTGVQDNFGNRIAYTLDAMGNRTKEEIFDAAQTLVQSRASVFDVYNRLQQDIGAANQTTTYAYDNLDNVLSVADPLNRTTSYQYDALNRLIQTTDAANGVIRYGYYNANDVLTSVSDPRNLTTWRTLDTNLSGPPTATISPDSGRTTVAYDSANNVIQKKDDKGQTTAYQYDALNRLIQETRADGQVVVYGYDSGPNGIGKLTSVADPSGTTSWRYDANGRVAQKTQTIGGVSLQTDYVHDSRGQLVHVIYPSGRKINYAWQEGRPAGVFTGDDWKSIATNVAWRPFGPLAFWIYGDGKVFSRSFDVDGRLIGDNLGALSYDAAGRIVSAYGKTYGYDALDRLTAFTDGGTPISYNYDATGNRTSQIIGSNTNTYAIAANSNRINSITGGATTLTYAHDANGSITNDGTYSYLYDAAGRLTQANQGSAVKGGYVLNGLGQRVRKTTAAGTTLFAYDEAGRLLGEYDLAGSMIQETVYLGDTPLAVVKPTGMHYIHPDHLNTPRKIYNQQGQLVWQWEMATFGASLPNENPSGLGAFKYNLRFAGQYFDEETGLHYNYFRDYDPKTGRYIQSDPIGLRGGLNTYAYVGGNPISFIDPLGLYTEIIVWNPVGMGSSSYGHLSTNINGSNNSWGPNGWDTKYPSAADYNDRQRDFRGGTGIILNLTPEQEAALAACLSSHSGPYSAFSNNCGTPIQSCLEKIGAGVGNSMLPTDVLENLQNSPNAIGTTSYPDPRNNSGFGSGLIWR